MTANFVTEITFFCLICVAFVKAATFLKENISTAAKAYADIDRSSHIVSVAVYLLGSMTNAANLAMSKGGEGLFYLACDDSLFKDATSLVVDFFRRSFAAHKTWASHAQVYFNYQPVYRGSCLMVV